MGAEAVVHAARSYLSNLEQGSMMLKLDYKNAFNSIRRDLMLHSVLSKVPRIFPLAFSAYRYPSLLFFDRHTILSAEGVQQGDPIGPLLFCLAIHDLISSLRSEFKVFYLDDGTLGGTLDDVKADLQYLEQASPGIGLSLNHCKSEIICIDESTKVDMLALSPSLRITDPNSASLLGTPIGGIQAINDVLSSKIENLRILGDRLSVLQAHDALCLLRNAFSLPKLLYVLRTAPCFSSHLLSNFDDLQRSLLECICNIHLSDSSWLQATLPINSGGLGIRSAVMLAPSAYLASAAGSTSVSHTILPARFLSITDHSRDEALQVWSTLMPNSVEPPSGSRASQQKSWDSPIVQGCFSTLITRAEPRAKARLLASQQKESGAWISAAPISALGLRMGNESIRIAVGLRLGAPLCEPHDCTLCGMPVDSSGAHGLSCRKSQGRIPRHSGLNELVKRALTAIDVPAILEPRGLCRTDDKRPDGMTIIPWAKGRALVWDVTCWDSLAPSYIHWSSTGCGLVADYAATKKCNLYKELSHSHWFQPIAFESLGTFGRDALDFIKELSRRTRRHTNDPLAYLKLCQRISVCIQNSNATSILGCCKV